MSVEHKGDSSITEFLSSCSDNHYSPTSLIYLLYMSTTEIELGLETVRKAGKKDPLSK
jgi:hypothetical protein